MSSVRRFAAVLIAAALAIPATAFADPFPSKPVRLVVAYAPGGATDVIARFLAAGLTSKWGQQVIVENKPGAGGMIGAELVSRAAPDGHSLLVAYTPEASINKLVYKSMSYDPQRDLVPVALVATGPLILATGPKLPLTSFQELMKRKNVPLSYGSAGTGGQQHLGGELLKLKTGLDLVHVPYKGTGPAVTDLLGGQIDLLFASSTPLLPHIRAGRLKPLFVTGNERQAELPDVPSAAEVGLTEFDIPTWFGVLAPKGMDPQLAQRIANDIGAILLDKAAVKPLEAHGLTIRYLPTKQFETFIASEISKYSDIVAKAGIEMR
jgi:tripartite-type tricarboxylate transporter receptor subunit TctC